MKNSPPQSGYAMLLSATDWPPARSASSRPVTETDLLLGIASGALRRLTIVETEARKYRLHVSLTAESDEHFLVNARGQPRQWSSLDSLARLIRCKYGSPTTVVLSFGNGAPTSGGRNGIEPAPDGRFSVVMRPACAMDSQRLTP
jgi:hypothetical protein